MSDLTAKQSRFVQEYLIDLNATQAAIRAGYSRKTANEQAAQLLAKPPVQAAIDAAKLARSERTQIDADWVLQRLANEAEADLAELYDDNNNLLPVEDWPLIFRQGLISGIKIEALYDGDGDGEERKLIGHVKEIKLTDRIRRLELIGKHVKVNAFQQVVEHRGLSGLAERLARAEALADDDDAWARRRRVEDKCIIDAVAVEVIPEPATVEAPSLPSPIPAGDKPARTPDLPAAKPAEYRPILPTPPQKGFSGLDYETPERAEPQNRKGK